MKTELRIMCLAAICCIGIGCESTCGGGSSAQQLIKRVDVLDYIPADAAISAIWFEEKGDDEAFQGTEPRRATLSQRGIVRAVKIYAGLEFMPSQMKLGEFGLKSAGMFSTPSSLVAIYEVEEPEGYLEWYEGWASEKEEARPEAEVRVVDGGGLRTVASNFNASSVFGTSRVTSMTSAVTAHENHVVYVVGAQEDSERVIQESRELRRVENSIRASDNLRRALSEATTGMQARVAIVYQTAALAESAREWRSSPGLSEQCLEAERVFAEQYPTGTILFLENDERAQLRFQIEASEDRLLAFNETLSKAHDSSAVLSEELPIVASVGSISRASMENIGDASCRGMPRLGVGLRGFFVDTMRRWGIPDDEPSAVTVAVDRPNLATLSNGLDYMARIEADVANGGTAAATDLFPDIDDRRAGGSVMVADESVDITAIVDPRDTFYYFSHGTSAWLANHRFEAEDIEQMLSSTRSDALIHLAISPRSLRRVLMFFEQQMVSAVEMTPEETGVAGRRFATNVLDVSTDFIERIRELEKIEMKVDTSDEDVVITVF